MGSRSPATLRHTPLDSIGLQVPKKENSDGFLGANFSTALWSADAAVVAVVARPAA